MFKDIFIGIKNGTMPHFTKPMAAWNFKAASLYKENQDLV
jgi:hypothetical protein